MPIKRHVPSCVFAFFLALSLPVSLLAIELPRVLLNDWSIELIKGEPDLVTPIGCRFDDKGRLFVVECHTHFPPEGYKGPQADRIYIFSDSNGDGSLDHQQLFYEGGRATMGLATQDGWLYVATRSEVIKIRDTNGDNRADEHLPLLKLETEADYPHNGLSSIALGPDGLLYIGQGENFGASYRLVGQSGAVQIGSGEGGNIFRCRPDGTALERYATGFWNPFGTCFDSAGRLWTVDNDPDSRPPCRLLHVLESADYGFQFRFGRAGTNPLLAWNGELPGTLPMVAGTGEAPCAVIPYEDKLWVTSWGDNRIELFTLKQQGSSWKADFETAVQGDTSFRPADMAIAPDGSIYVTDWVDRSYPVHSKGRLWKLTKKNPCRRTLPSLTNEETQANSLVSTSNARELRVKAVESQDPFYVQAAIAGMSRFDHPLKSKPPETERAMLAWLQACRWSELCNLGSIDQPLRFQRLTSALTSPFASVRRLAIRYCAETEDKNFMPFMEQSINREGIESMEFGELVAAINYLDAGQNKSNRDPKLDLLMSVLQSAHRSMPMRTMALRALPSQSKVPTESDLVKWVEDTSDQEFQRQAIWLLSGRKTNESYQALLRLAENSHLKDSIRADAIACLKGTKELLKEMQLEDSAPQIVRLELDRVLAETQAATGLPDTKDFDAWWQEVGQGGDAVSGRRVFQRSVCITCHAYEGRGAQLAPDLSTLKGTSHRKKLLESILDPSREIGPLYLSWKILTTDGRTLIGSKLNGGGVGNKLRYLSTDGSTFELELDEIEEQQASPVSIMPTDALRGLTLQEVRDLLALLE